MSADGASSIICTLDVKNTLRHFIMEAIINGNG